MTDPIEDRLRTHFADRAAQVTAEPDPSAIVERSAVRPRLGVPLIAGLVAAVAVLTGGGFLTGVSVAGSSPAPVVGPAAAPTSTGPESAASGGPASGAEIPAATSPAGLAPLFTRTTTSGVTIRAYASGTPASELPTPQPCPAGVECAHPMPEPLPSTGTSIPSTGTSVNGVTGSGSSGTTASTVISEPPTTTGTVGSATPECQGVTLEMSTEQAVSSVDVSGPPAASLEPDSVQVLGTGTFGIAEGGPAGWVDVLVGSDVSSVRLVSSTGAVSDAMTPIGGVAVLAASGATVLGGASVVGLDGAGTTLPSVPVDQGVTPASSCTTPIPTPTPTPGAPGAPVTPVTPVTTTTVPDQSVPGSGNPTMPADLTGPSDPPPISVVPSTSPISVGPTS